MRHVSRSLVLLFAIALLCLALSAQQSDAPQGAATVPRLVNFSGKATDAQGKALSGIAGATFAIYKDQYEGSPLWLETQNIQADAKGSYTVQLGATRPDGLPLDLFSSGEARWLGVTVNGGQEQPRVLLLSVPYALKAADAETVGGLPASAFVLANEQQQTAASAKVANQPSPKTAAPPANPAVTGKGALDFIPMWDSASDIVDSIMFQKTSQIGINTTAPAATLDVNGKTDVRDTLTLFPKSTDPTLAINGTTFKVDQTGKMTFVSGQTFPGTGTVTSVGLSAPTSDFKVTGSPVTKSGTLSLNWNVAPTNANTANAIVKRDASGNFLANTITAAGQLFATALTGNGNAISGSSAASNATVIYGGASSTTGATWAVEGETFSSDPGTSGVVGRARSGGTGVTGFAAPGGNSFYADSNVQQARTMGGWEAMVYVDGPNARMGGCFNSTLLGTAVTTPPCGFGFDASFTGDYIIDFGSEVDDRFFSITQANNPSVYMPAFYGVCDNTIGVNCNNTLTANQVEITSAFEDNGQAITYRDSKFYVIVY